MIAFQVDDMTCGHCVSSITRAVKSADRNAEVTVDLSQHRVMVEPSEADAQELGEAIAEAGYTPVLIQETAAEDRAPAVDGRSCCGCR